MTRKSRRQRSTSVPRRSKYRPLMELLEDRLAPATITVTGTGDTIAEDGAVTLREAMTAANNNAASGDAPAGEGGAVIDRIEFNIPGSGVQTIRPASQLPTIGGRVVIDGYTQPGASPNTNTLEQGGSNAVLLIELDGSAAINGLNIYAPATVQGLAIGHFSDGINLDSAAHGSVIAGNFIGTDASGAEARGNTNGVNIWGQDSITVGGTTPAARNVISGNTSYGVFMFGNPQVHLPSSIRILGNLIGTDKTGTARLGNGLDGIGGAGSNWTITGNVISGNGFSGISGTGPGSVIQGNFIGTDVTGTQAMGNGSHGIFAAFNGTLAVGGTNADDRNVIAFNSNRGVNLSSTIRAALLGNAIHGNGSLGIDLGENGVTNNDAGDVDTGANGLQNFPILTGITRATTNSTVRGRLNSTPFRSFLVQFFASSSPDPSGHGEGQRFLGELIVSTDNNGDVRDAEGNLGFAHTIDGVLPLFDAVTATATLLEDTDNNPGTPDSPTLTSEFGPVFLTPVIQFPATAFAFDEDAGQAIVTVTRGGNTAGAVAVLLNITGGTASEPDDYTQPVSLLVSFAAGETSKTAVFSIRDDGLSEGTENITLALSNPTNGADLGSQRTAVVVIVDNEPPNTEAPIALDDEFTVHEDTNSAINPLLNDSDAESVLEFTATGFGSLQLVTLPAHGSLSIVSGQMRYAPEADYSGPDSFTYRASDGTFTSDVATVSITVLPANDPPVAQDDTVEAFKDTPATFNVLANDTDPDNDTLEVIAVSTPQFGTASINPDNTIAYQPAPGSLDSDTFTYTARDAAGVTATATVLVIMNDPPDTTPPIKPSFVGSNPASPSDDTTPILLGQTEPGALVRLYTNPSGTGQFVAQGTADASGDFAIEVTVAPSSTTTFYATAVDAAGNVSNVSTGLVYVHAASDPGRITGQSFDDFDADGLHDPDELGLNDRVVELVDRISGQVVATQVTHDLDLNDDAVIDPVRERGIYRFDVTPGTYDVRQQDQDGWAPAAAATIRRVSLDVDGQETTQGYSAMPSIDAAGNRMVFTIGDPGQFPAAGVHMPLVLRNLLTNSLSDLPIDAIGLIASELPRATISADGQWLAYEAFMPDQGIVTGLLDLNAYVATTLSFDITATTPSRRLGYPALSADGRFTVFASRDPHGFAVTAEINVFVYDRVNATYELLSKAENGTPADAASREVAITPDGRHVAFYSAANNLVEGDSGLVDVFVVDRLTGQVDRIAANRSALPSVTAINKPDLALSADGRFVTFTSDDDTLVAGDANGSRDVFVFDRNDRSLQRISVGVGGQDSDQRSEFPQISADGRYVAFISRATNLVSGDTNGEPDLFVHDRALAVTTRLAVNALGVEGNGQVFASFAITPDASVAVFSSDSSNLAGGDNNGESDIFVQTMPVGIVVTAGAQRFGPEFANRPAADAFLLTVQLAGTGLGNVTDSSGGINAVVDRTEPFAHNTIVTLTATPAAGSTFAGWSGAASGNSAVIQVTMDSVKEVTATFTSAAPVAADDVFTLLEDAGFTVLDVLANDLAGAAGGPLKVSEARPPDFGIVGLLPRGANLAYTPEANFHGTVTFEYTVSDEHGGSDTATVTVIVLSQSDAPTAANQDLATSEDSPVAFALAAGDGDGDALTVVIPAGQGPQHGTLSGDGLNFTYTPDPNYFGVDSFTYSVSDGTLSSAEATVTIAISPVDDPPDARDDVFSVPGGNLDVLANDVNLDLGETLTIVSISFAAHGNVTLASQGAALQYAPDTGFVGEDTFTYTITDGHGNFDTATVTLFVSQVNRPPSALALTVAAIEDDIVGLTLVGTDLDGDALTYAVIEGPAHGTLSGTGPNLLYQPNADYFGPDVFSYVASDGTLTSAPAWVEITVSPTNDVPMATADHFTIDEDSVAQSLDVLANDSVAPDAGEVLTVLAVDPAVNGTVEIIDGGARVRYTPYPDFVGEDSFIYVVSDDHGGSASATVTITVLGVANRHPLNSVPSARLTLEDTPLTMPLSFSDADGDTGPYTVSLSVLNGTVNVAGTGGAVNGNNTGLVTITGSQSEINSRLAAVTYQGTLNFNGNDTLTMTTTDESGLSDTDTVAITIAPVVEAPVNTLPAGPIEVSEGGQVALPGLAVDAIDLGAGLLRVDLSVGAGGIDVTAPPGLTVSGNHTNHVVLGFGTLAEINEALATLAYRASESQESDGAETLTIKTAANGSSLFDQDTLPIQVTAVNDAPHVEIFHDAQSADADYVEGFSESLSIEVFDADAFDGLYRATLKTSSQATVNIVRSGPGGTITGDNTNEVTVEGTLAQIKNLLGLVEYTVVGDAPPGGTVLTVAVNDNGNAGAGGAKEGIDTLVFNVSAVNDAPVNVVPASFTTDEDQPFLLDDVDVTDPDAGNGILQVTVSTFLTSGTLTFVAIGLPGTVTGAGTQTVTMSGTLAQLNDLMDAILYTPPSNVTVSDTLTITTHDQGHEGTGGAKSDTDVVEINFTPVNDAPQNVFSGYFPSSAVEETQIPLAFSIFDVDVDATDVMTVTLHAEHGRFFVVGGWPTSVTVLGNATPDMILTGTQHDLNIYVLSGLTSGGTLYYRSNLDFNGNETLTIETNDNGNRGVNATPLTDVDTRSLTVTNLNDAPVNNVPPSAVAVRTNVVKPLSGISVSDPGRDEFVSGNVLLTVLHGKLGVDIGDVSNWVTVTGNNSNSLRITPTSLAIQDETTFFPGRVLALINDRLETLTYLSDPGYEGPDVVVMTTNDGGSSSQGGAKVDMDNIVLAVAAIHDPPVNNVPTGTLLATTDVRESLSGFSVSDVDEVDTERVTLTVLHGTLRVTGSAGSVTGNNSKNLVLEGTLAQNNARLATLSYLNDSGYEGTDILTMVTSDLAADPRIDTNTVVISVSPDEDGIKSTEENNAPNNGDANADGVLDREQADVASLVPAAGHDPALTYITIATSEGAPLQAVDNRSASQLPPDDPALKKPFGVNSFNIVTTPGGTVSVEVILHGLTSTAGLTYRKFGPTSPGGNSQWYTLPNVQFVKRTIAGKPAVVAQLKLTDGQIGDSTGVDGLIVDPGAVATIPENPGVRLQNGVLRVVGTATNDTVKVTRTGNRLQVFASFVPGAHTRSFALTSVKQIHVSLGDGNDRATIAPQIRVPAVLDGGDGNDVLRAGSGRSVLLGGAGADALFGGLGRSLAVGGAGRDRLTAGAGASILVGGTTAFDAHTEALLAIAREWDSKRPVATRIKNLRGGSGSANRANGVFFLKASGSNATVFDDDAIDKLTGSAGRDWFFANLEGGVRDIVPARSV